MYLDGVGPCCHGKRNEALAPHLSSFDTGEAQEAATLRAIVRGEQPLEALKGTSVTINASHIEWPAAGYRNGSIALTAADLAEGMLRLKNNPDALGEWASFILVASDHFVFEDRHTGDCDRLLSFIWKLAFGVALGDPAIRFAASVRNSFAYA